MTKAFILLLPLKICPANVNYCVDKNL